MKHLFDIKRFATDEDGAMLVIWGVSFVVILGIVALSFDMGRVAVTQTELQSYADNVALAAAGELDGENDAITRATDAAANLIADRKTYGSGGDDLSGAADYTLTFLSELPASDANNHHRHHHGRRRCDLCPGAGKRIHR